MNLQKEIDNLHENGAIHLKPGEIKGPVLIKKPCTIEGNNTILWHHEGPVVEIFSDNVILKSLRIEVSDNARNNTQCAIRVHNRRVPIFDDIEIRGLIEGLPEESGTWDYPPVLSLDVMPPHKRFERKMTIISPIQCRLISKTAGISFTNNILNRGFNDIKIIFEPLSPNTIIYGDIFIQSKVLRRIRIHGNVGDTKICEEPLNESTSSDLSRIEKGERLEIPVSLVHPKVTLNFSKPFTQQLRIVLICISIKDKQGKFYSDVYNWDTKEISSTVISTGDMRISFSELAQKYHKIIIFAGFRNDSSNLSFQDLSTITIQILDEKDEGHYIFENFNKKSHLLIVGEFYSIQDHWKFKAIGEGYRGDWTMLENEYQVKMSF